MGVQNESYDGITRVDGSGTGVIFWQCDSTRNRTNSPAKVMQDANLIHDKEPLTVQILAATVDQPLFIPTEGTWQLDSVKSIRRVVGSDGGAVTADLMVAASGTAPASGTTALSAVDSINLKSPAADIIQDHTLATTAVTISPGQYLGLNVAGTLTAVVAMLMVSLKRIA